MIRTRIQGSRSMDGFEGIQPSRPSFICEKVVRSGQRATEPARSIVWTKRGNAQSPTHQGKLKPGEAWTIEVREQFIVRDFGLWVTTFRHVVVLIVQAQREDSLSVLQPDAATRQNGAAEIHEVTRAGGLTCGL